MPATKKRIVKARIKLALWISSEFAKLKILKMITKAFKNRGLDVKYQKEIEAWKKRKREKAYKKRIERQVKEEKDRIEEYYRKRNNNP